VMICIRCVVENIKSNWIHSSFTTKSICYIKHPSQLQRLLWWIELIGHL
jgi:hypothetical protein